MTACLSCLVEVADHSRSTILSSPEHKEARSSGRFCVVYASAGTPGRMQQMADLDLVVARRYHNAVCALRMSTPTISIGYAADPDALLAEVGCPHSANDREFGLAGQYS